MFHKALVRLLCVCMLVGSVPASAYAIEAPGIEQSGFVEEETATEESEAGVVSLKNTEETENDEGWEEMTKALAVEEYTLKAEEITHSTARVWWEEIVEEGDFILTRKIAYAPVDEPEKQINVDIDTMNNFGEYYIEDLKPDTRYRLWLMDSNFYTLKEITFTTESVTLDVSYEVQAIGCDEINVAVNVMEYDGFADSLELYVEGYENKRGGTGRNISIELEKSEDGRKSGNLSFRIDNLEGGKTYSFNFYLKDTVSSPKYCEVTKTVTMPEGVISAENITLAAAQNEEIPTTLDVTVSLDRVMEKALEAVLYCYLPRTGVDWNNSWFSVTIPVGETATTVSIPGLVEGIEYELLLTAWSIEENNEYSFTKKMTYRLGESVCEPVVTHDLGSIFSDLTYRLQSSTPLEEAEWRVEAEIYINGYWTDLGYEPLYLTSENEYTVTCYTLPYIRLNTNTEYTVRWTLYKDGQIHHVYDYDFTTGYPDISTEAEVGIDAMNYKITYNSTLSKENTMPLYVKVTEKGTNNFYDQEIFLDGNSDRAQTLTFTQLKPDTSYDIGIYGGRDGELFKTETITTMVDDKVINIRETAGMIAALFEVESEGTFIEGQADNVKIFYRKKGSEKWLTEIISIAEEKTSEDRLYLNGLDGNSTYEYEIGIIPDVLFGRDRLRAKKTGEFTTAPDIRLLKYDSMYVDSNTARIYFDIENEETVSIYVWPLPSGFQCYYREIGSVEWNEMVWRGSPAVYLEDLKENTTYEYEIGLNGGREADRAELKSVLTGTFTTRETNSMLSNYVVGKAGELGVEEVTEVIYLHPGETLEGLGLYTVSGNTLTKADGFTVLVENNELVQWNQETGTLRAVNPGSTDVYFEKDGVKVRIQVQVTEVPSTEEDILKEAGIFLSTDTEGIEIDRDNGILSFNFTSDMKGKKINLKAEVKDKEGNHLEVPLIWKVTDKTVATIAPSKSDSHRAVLTVKGEGHAVLTVQTRDKEAYTKELDLKFRNYAPRVSTSKTRINKAIDYEDRNGIDVAYRLFGGIGIVEAYGNRIHKISFLKQDGTTEPSIAVEKYDSANRIYILKPIKTDIPTGTYKYTMMMETEKGNYKYPMTIIVENKQPSVKAKMSSKVNLFYKKEVGKITLTVGERYTLDHVIWKDNSEAAGFDVQFTDTVHSSKKQHLYYLDVNHANVEVKNRKLADTNTANGTLEVKVRGFREPVEIRNFFIGYQYKVPKLKAMNASSNIIPKVGITNSSFRIYNSQMKRYLYYDVAAVDSNSSYDYYDHFIIDNPNVSGNGDGIYIDLHCKGKQKKESLNLTLDSKDWREPLKVKHTVKVMEPKAYLSKTILTYNKATGSVGYTGVYMKNVEGLPSLMGIEYTPSNVKAKTLTDENIFTMEYTGSGMAVSFNSTEILNAGEELKPGTYSYKLTPYYRNAETGEKTALNTLTLKIKVIDKPVAVKVTPKGKLDLLYSYNWEGYDRDGNERRYSSLYLTHKFSNLPSDYYIEATKLKGENSEYFNLKNNRYLQISEEGIEKLKAGHTYHLSVEYTFINSMGDTLVVESNVFKVKPVQSAPKITVQDNNQILYASNSDLSRTYNIYTSYYYNIKNLTGSLDVNKDGKPDLVATMSEKNYSSAQIEVSIRDADAITATAKGKTYSIPLKVTFEGRDGISKDVTTNLKVIVKR